MYYNANDIRTAFTSLVGFRDTIDQSLIPNPNASLLQSDSGLYVNDVREGIMSNATLYSTMQESSQDPNIITDSTFQSELQRSLEA